MTHPRERLSQMVDEIDCVRFNTLRHGDPSKMRLQRIQDPVEFPEDSFVRATTGFYVSSLHLHHRTTPQSFFSLPNCNDGQRRTPSKYRGG